MSYPAHEILAWFRQLDDDDRYNIRIAIIHDIYGKSSKEQKTLLKWISKTSALVNGLIQFEIKTKEENPNLTIEDHLEKALKEQQEDNNNIKKQIQVHDDFQESINRSGPSYYPS